MGLNHDSLQLQLTEFDFPRNLLGVLQVHQKFLHFRLAQHHGRDDTRLFNQPPSRIHFISMLLILPLRLCYWGTSGPGMENWLDIPILCLYYFFALGTASSRAYMIDHLVMSLG
jgi:hypothetical protein